MNGERAMTALEADVASIKDVMFGKGNQPGLDVRVDNIERTLMKMEAVWDSLIALAKVVGSIVSFAVVLCELIRALDPLLHH